MSVHLQPVRLASGNDDTEAQLVFVDGGLVAVLTHLSELHDEAAGMWFLEAGFGSISVRAPPTFANLDEAQDWIAGRLAEV